MWELKTQLKLLFQTWNHSFRVKEVDGVANDWFRSCVSALIKLPNQTVIRKHAHSTLLHPATPKKHRNIEPTSFCSRASGLLVSSLPWNWSHWDRSRDSVTSVGISCRVFTTYCVEHWPCTVLCKRISIKIICSDPSVSIRFNSSSSALRGYEPQGFSVRPP